MQGSLAARDVIADPRYRATSLFQPQNLGRRQNIVPSRVRVRASQTDMDVSLKSGRQRRSQNVDGEFYVDHRCIDCDTCRWMAPETFTRKDELSAVCKQPTTEDERFKALQALLSCPTASIHTEKPPRDILEVQKSFPLPINSESLPGVYHCGYHSAKSYGAASYLIVHAEGNILVDSPSYKEKLARNIDMLGGVRIMFLSHRDDVADQDKWAKRFKCERIIHSLEVQEVTADVERKLAGEGPWYLGPDFEIIFTPGHTEGSVCLLYKPLKALFAGDHIAQAEGNPAGVAIFENYNWYSVPIQLKSVEKLLSSDFKWILPGHGRRVEFADIHEKNAAIEAFLLHHKQPHLQLV